MAVLLMRFTGPMQSWGTQSRFTVRDTGMEPSKSGVIGLTCAALGRPRSAPVDDLAALRMGVRVDREGTMQMDYHTALNVALAKGGVKKDAVVSRRYYLADADFLVGLEGDNISRLEEIHVALRNPHWTLYLGRKAFVPSVPVWIPDGLKENTSLEDALKQYPWPRPLTDVPKKRPERLRVVLQTEFGVGEDVRHDQPVGAAYGYSRGHNLALRYVRTDFWPLGGENGIPIRQEEEVCISQD